MIYSIVGKLAGKRENYVILENNSIGFKIFVPGSVIASPFSLGSNLKFFCHLYIREDLMELYGFLEEKELQLFEKLNNVSGIGPKSALGVLGIAKIDQLIAAINEGRVELLTRASGIGKKTADRIVLELKGKLSLTLAPQMISLMESDVELEETLVSLGYNRAKAKALITAIDPKTTGFKDRLKEALRGGKNTH